MGDYLKIDTGFVHLPDTLGTEILHSLEKWIRWPRLVMKGIQRIVPVWIEIVFFQRDDHHLSYVHHLRGSGPLTS
jgi:hypothetical protein